MSATAKRSVTVTLDGTNKSTSLPLISGTAGADVFDIRRLYSDLGVFTYDPGYGAHRRPARARSPISTATPACCMYRGYPIEQLAENSHFLEVCYLLLNGELPNATRGGGIRDRRAAAHHAA